MQPQKLGGGTYYKYISRIPNAPNIDISHFLAPNIMIVATGVHSL